MQDSSSEKVSGKTDGFYHTKEWRRIRREVLRRDQHRCIPCWQRKQLTVANTVHHIKSLEEHPDLALTMSNLESICPSCHNRKHPERGKRKQKIKKRIKMVEEVANPEII